MTKELISRDEVSIRTGINLVIDSATRLENVAKSLKAHGIERVEIAMLLEGIRKIFKGPKVKEESIINWIKELKVSGMKNPQIEGVPIDKAKLIEMIEVKADTSGVLQAIQAASSGTIGNENTLNRFLVIDSMGVITPRTTFKEQIREKYSHYANENQVEILRHIKDVIKHINSIEDFAEKQGCALSHDTDNPFYDVPYFTWSEKGLEPNPKYIELF